MTEHRVKVEGGRYEFIVRVHGRIDIHRDGKPWVWDLDATTADPMAAVHAIMMELDAARVVVQAARQCVVALNAPDAEPVAPERLHLALVALEGSIALHDRLVSDREPPSAWCGAPSTPSGDCTCAGGDAGGHDLDCERREH